MPPTPRDPDAHLPLLSKWDLLRLLRFTTQPASPSAPASAYLARLAYLRLLLTHACSPPLRPHPPNRNPPIAVRHNSQHAVPDRVLIEHALFGMREELAAEVRGCGVMVGTGFHLGEEEGFGVERARMGMVWDVKGEGRGMTWAKFERVVGDCEERLSWRDQNRPQVSSFSWTERPRSGILLNSSGFV